MASRPTHDTLAHPTERQTDEAIAEIVANVINVGLAPGFLAQHEADLPLQDLPIDAGTINPVIVQEVPIFLGRWWSVRIIILFTMVATTVLVSITPIAIAVHDGRSGG